MKKNQTPYQIKDDQSFKVRKDLKVEQQIYDGISYHVIKDPLTLKYYRIKDAEYLIFRLLDGNRTVREVIEAVKNEFPDIHEDEIKGFILHMRNANLIETHGPGIDKVMYHRSHLKKKAKIKQTLMGFLFIKIPLIDPDRYLDKIYPKIKFIFTKGFFLLTVALLMLAVFFAINKSSMLIEQAMDFFAPRNIILIFISIMIIKAFHELGHAFTCKHFGGEVHEMGVLLVVFTPWLYVNVSDSWVFQNSRQRFKVSVAGIVTELFVASIAAIIWWFTDHGFINSLCFNIMIVCSVDNLLRNGNPLLRYDGYYAFSDFLEKPNLMARSRLYLTNLLKKYILRVPVIEEEMSLKDRMLYLSYGSLSVAYRIFILLAIAAFVSKRFFIVGLLMASLIIFSSVFMPILKSIRFIINNRKEIGHRGPVAVVLAMLPIFLIILSFIYKTELKIESPFSVEPEHRAVIRPESGGFLDTIYKTYGQKVEKGEVIAILRNPELTLSRNLILKEMTATEYEERKAISLNDISVFNQQKQERLRLQKALQIIDDKISKLKIVAHIDGVVVTRKLEERIGDFIEQGSPLMEIASLQRKMIKAYVSDVDITEIKKGQYVELKTKVYPETTLKGQIVEILNKPLKSVDNLALSERFGGIIPTEPHPQLGEILRRPYFEIKIDIGEGQLQRMRLNMVGIAKIYSGKRTLASIILRRILNLIKPELLLH